MKKSFFRSLMLIALLSIGTHVFAHDFEVGGIYYNITSDSDLTVEVTYRGSSLYDYEHEYTGSVVIPESVTHNGTTYSVTRIREQAFNNCSKLSSVTIPNSVISIGYQAFSYCKGLTSVTIPNTVTDIGEAAFDDCTGLTNITIPNSVTSIKDQVFRGCSKLSSVTIPNSVISIGEQAFSYCYGLISVTIPESVKSIGDYAFAYCTGLTSVTIGNSVTSIGDCTFADCTDLTSVISLNLTPPVCGTTVFNYIYIHNHTLTVPTESVSAYKAADTWKDFTNIIGKDFSGVEETLADDGNAPAEYYDLNGVRVQNPEKGVYIKRVGNTTLKVIL